MHVQRGFIRFNHAARPLGLPPHVSAALLVRLLEQVDREITRDTAVARNLLARANELLRRDTSAREAGRTGCLAPWQERRVREHVAANLHASLRVEDMAAVAQLSPGYFKRAFKASFGETPHGYLTRMRLEHAQRMMLEGRESLAQIAAACGLSDQSHLSRVFRQATGSSPSAWRRLHANAP
jgi:AraC-like DNA-binding protein